MQNLGTDWELLVIIEVDTAAAITPFGPGSGGGAGRGGRRAGETAMQNRDGRIGHPGDAGPASG